jgi:hypothetical protein
MLLGFRNNKREQEVALAFRPVQESGQYHFSTMGSMEEIRSAESSIQCSGNQEYRSQQELMPSW